MSTRILLIGDLALNGLFSAEPDQNRKRFDSISKLIGKDDIVMANLEFPIKTQTETNEYKNIVYGADKDVTHNVLQQLNIKCVSLANNHIYDFKAEGLKQSIELLDELKIKHTGAGLLPKHIEPVIMDADGLKVGFIAYVDKSTNPKTEKFKELFINYFEPDKVIQDIKQLQNKVHKIICSIHWGIDYSRFFTKDQQVICRKLIDAGADIIMGHHPHTYQPYEIYKGKYIFYSLGQLCFGDFIWEGELRALKRKTKISYIPLINKNLVIDKFIKTRDLKGNYIKVYSNNYFKSYNHFLLFINSLMINYKLVHWLLSVKESFLDRFIEYFFGYYRNPIKQIFKIENLRKVNYINRQYNQYK